MTDSEKQKLEDFFKHDHLVSLREKPGTMAACDWNTALGNTIKEKYESFYIKLIEITNVCVRKGASGLFWVVTSPEIGSMFETASNGFSESGLTQIPMGSKEVYHLGTIARQWRVYIDPLWEADELMVGANWEPNPDPKHIGVLKVCNFII